jgi:hypothetical protein
MSVPGPPNINLQPLASPNTLEYEWEPPTNPNGTILAYKLTVAIGPTTIYTNSSIPPTEIYYYLGPPEITLTNGTTYSSYLQAINENGEGEQARFIDFQPGNAPDLPPANAIVNVTGSNQVAVSWTPPTNLGSLDATIFWYTIFSRSNNLSDPVLSYTANGLTQSNYNITGLNNLSRYYFEVNAVNCPGYSPPAITGTIGFIPVFDYVFETSFPTLTNTINLSNYDSNRLMVNTPTGVGYSYLTTENYTSSNLLSKRLDSNITTNTVTFACSIYRTESVAYSGLLLQRNIGGGGTCGFIMSLDGTKLGYIWNGSSSTYTYDTGVVIPTNEWYNVTLTISPSNVKWYVNGELAHTRIESHIALTISNLFIGNDPGDTLNDTNKNFSGYMDNIQFYSRVLTDAEIYSIYKYYQAAQTSTAIPTSITGLQAWYDGSDPLGTGTAPSSGTTVTTWSDKSGNTRNATGVGSPTYISNNFGYVNFNGTSQRYTLSTGSFIVGQYFTIFVVERLQGNASTNPCLIGGTSTTINQNLFLSYNGTNAVNFRLGFYANELDAAGLVSAFSIAGAQPVRIWAFRQIASQRSTWLNGRPLAQDTNNTLLSAWAGAGIGFNGNYFSGRMMDILFYTGQLSIQNMQNIIGYLAQKWYVSLPPFIPPRVTGLVLWLDANDSSSFTLSGSNVTQWRDKSGSGNHFSVVSGTPRRITDGSLTVVNIPNGAVMTGTTSISLTSTSFSIFAVVRVTATNSNTFEMLLSIGANTDKSIRYSGAQSLSTIQLQGGPNVASNTGDLIGVAQVNGSRNATASSVYTAYHLLDGPLGQTVSGIPHISSSFMNRYFVGNVCEFLIFNTAMINLNREKVQGYLAWKWGINSRLPSTHTYYSVAPSY